MLPLVAVLGRLAASIAAQQALSYGMEKAGDFAQDHNWTGAADFLHNDFAQNVLPGILTGGAGLAKGMLQQEGAAALRNPALWKGLGSTSLGELKNNFIFDSALNTVKSLLPGQSNSPEPQPQLNSQSFFNEEAFDPRYLSYYQVDPMQTVRDRYTSRYGEENPYGY